MKPVLVFGATGYTGRLVVSSLLELGVRDVVLAGKSEDKLRTLSAESGNLEYRLADATRPETLQEMVRGAHVVVSTVGPFIEFGEPVVRAALEQGAHFLDTSGEQAYMLRILDRFDEAARAKRCAIVNAQAFEYALGCCAGALLAENDPEVTSVDVIYRVERFQMSRGTQRTAPSVVSGTALMRRNGALVEVGPFVAPGRVRFPERSSIDWTIPLPGGEALHLARAYPRLKDVTTNIVLPAPLAVAVTAGWPTRKVTEWLYRKNSVRAAVERMTARTPGPDEASRRAQRFQVMARCPNATRLQAVIVSGSDVYGITGTIAALGARLLVDGEPKAVGVISTNQAFGARPFLEALEPYGIRLTYVEGRAEPGAPRAAAGTR
jgi:short subunit dehydrogenase-like uncharacterized protein